MCSHAGNITAVRKCKFTTALITHGLTGVLGLKKRTDILISGLWFGLALFRRGHSYDPADN